MDIAAKPTVEEVNLEKLVVDLRVQQALRESRVKEMLKRGFDTNLVGTITVSERTDGTFVILDGQHRTEGAKRSGVGALTAQVFRGLTIPQEAYLFTYLNKKQNPTAVTTFRTRVLAGEPVPVAIEQILQAHGWGYGEWSPASTKRNGVFSAVVKAEKIYNGLGPFKGDIPGHELFASTISAITSAWSHSAEASRGEMIGGIALFIQRFHGHLSRPRLLEVLSATTARQFMAGGRDFHALRKGSADEDFAYFLYEAYNKRLRHKLPEFRWRGDVQA